MTIYDSDASRSNTSANAAGTQPLQNTTNAASDSRAPVMVYMAGDNEEADVVRATLAAAGIPALLGSPSVTTFMGAVDTVTSDTNNLSVWVAPGQADDARAILQATPPSEEELAAEMLADPTTLAEAEARVR